jgi:hypothetical protein
MQSYARHDRRRRSDTEATARRARCELAETTEQMRIAV